MRILIALLILIAFSTDAQACWPPANIVDNSTNEVEPVKIVEPVEETPEVIDEEEAEEETSANEGTEVFTPAIDTTDEVVTEETEITETPVSEAGIGVKAPRSGGYGEAHVVELTASDYLIEDDEARLVETEPVLLASIISNSTVRQDDSSNITSMNSGNNHGSYVPVAIALVMLIMVAVAIYQIRK